LIFDHKRKEENSPHTLKFPQLRVATHFPQIGIEGPDLLKVCVKFETSFSKV
jgi:hypothetical protein